VNRKKQKNSKIIRLVFERRKEIELRKVNPYSKVYQSKRKPGEAEERSSSGS
jgi:hypothetical protein